MSAVEGKMTAVSHFLHPNLLRLIILSYALAAALPGPGLWLKEANVLGIAARAALGEIQVASLERRLKIVAPLTLLVLCYANASFCLPQALGQPDWDFLGIIFVFVSCLCTLTFAAGHAIGRMVGADRGQRAALMFGLGMNNNGTGLVLASLAMGSQPLVMLPIIVYNLAQHLIAGGVDALLRRADQA